MHRYARHFLVCITNRPPEMQASCGARGSLDVLARMQREADRRKLRELYGVGVTGTTCIGGCDEGPNVLVYPENVGYRGVRVADVVELVESHAARGEPVARLLAEDGAS
jgi:(2Fe-2S) ferredoxin